MPKDAANPADRRTAAAGGTLMFKWKAGYRHYNLLVDISFWVLLFSQVRGLLKFAGVPSTWLLYEWPVTNIALGVVILAVQLGMIVLILMRRLRDEYAEQLWQKSAASFVKLLPVFPIIWFGAIYILSKQGGTLDFYRANPNEYFLPDHAVMPNPNRAAGIYQFEGASYVILKLSAHFPLVFAALYKWHRWRDER